MDRKGESGTNKRAVLWQLQLQSGTAASHGITQFLPHTQQLVKAVNFPIDVALWVTRWGRS